VIADEAVRGHVPPLWFRALKEDRGQHSLKGMPGEWRLFSLAD
jgi:hypothetical protein